MRPFAREEGVRPMLEGGCQSINLQGVKYIHRRMPDLTWERMMCSGLAWQITNLLCFHILLTESNPKVGEAVIGATQPGLRLPPSSAKEVRSIVMTDR